MPRSIPRIFVIFALALAAAGLGCDRAPSATGLPEWSPRDHDGEQKASAAQAPRGDAGAVSLVALTWERQCASCHGPLGRGDGPQAPMYKPRDLTDEAWQAATTDAAIETAIREGKGRMPRFDLPPDVVRGLVGRIRAARAQPRP